MCMLGFRHLFIHSVTNVSDTTWQIISWWDSTPQTALLTAVTPATRELLVDPAFCALVYFYTFRSAIFKFIGFGGGIDLLAIMRSETAMLKCDVMAWFCHNLWTCQPRTVAKLQGIGTSKVPKQSFLLISLIFLIGIYLQFHCALHDVCKFVEIWTGGISHHRVSALYQSRL